MKKNLNQNDVEFDLSIGHALILFQFFKKYTKNVQWNMYIPSYPLEIHIHQYILDIKRFYQISWELSQVPLETPQTIRPNPISHMFISILSDVITFTKTLSNHDADDAWTSNVCHRHNFHRRDLKFSDIVHDTRTIYDHKKKKLLQIWSP